MKKTLLIISIMTIMGCDEKKAARQLRGEIKALNGLSLSSVADSLFTEYVTEVPGAPAYAIFIDKKSGRLEYMLTFAPFNKAVKDMYEAGALNYFMLADTIPVFIYSGLEDFIGADTLAFTRNNVTQLDGEFKDYYSVNGDIDFDNSWSYMHLDTGGYIVRGNNHPFIGSTLVKPTVQFKVTDIQLCK